MRRLFGKGLVSLAFVASAAILAASGGCANQSEGDRCSTLNGNDDCSDGLECVSGGTLGTSTDICCPPLGTATTTTTCAVRNQGNVDSGIPETGPDTSIVPDTSTAPDTSTVPDTSTAPDTSVTDAPAEGG